MTEKSCDRFLAYFNKDVLNGYKIKPNIFEINEDDYGGFIYNIRGVWYQIRYAFRKMTDGNIAVAAWIPDLVKISDDEKNIWRVYELESPNFVSPDKPFDDWIGTFLSPGGFFPKTTIRPIANVCREIRYINAVTKLCCGEDLFKKEYNPHLQYPSAENTKSYRFSVLELHNLVNDEMNQDTIEIIATHLNVPLEDSSKKLNSLKELLSGEKIKFIHKPLRDCANKRAKIHGVSSKETESFDAYDTFDSDLNDVGDALTELKLWLEDTYSVNAEACLRRVEMESSVPELEEQSHLKTIFESLKEAQGKTIEKIEFGKQKSYENCHESEGINFHFNDGTSLFVRIGSNSQNVADSYEGLKANDFHTDFMFYWAPAIKK